MKQDCPEDVFIWEYYDNNDGFIELEGSDQPILKKTSK